MVSMLQLLISFPSSLLILSLFVQQDPKVIGSRFIDRSYRNRKAFVLDWKESISFICELVTALNITFPYNAYVTSTPSNGLTLAAPEAPRVFYNDAGSSPYRREKYEWNECI